MKETDALAKQRLEGKNQIVNQIGHLLERWEQRLTLNNLRLMDRYVKAEIHLLVHFIIGSTNEEFIARLEWAEVICWPQVGTEVGKFGRLRKGFSHRLYHIGTDVELTEGGPYRQNQSVLVDIVKFVETPERVVPSFVRFDRVDRFYGLLPHALYFSCRRGFVFRGIISDGKVNVVSGFVPPGADEKELIGQMVQRRPKILKGVPRDHCDGWAGRGNPDYIIDQLSRLRIALGSDYIGIGLEKGFNNDLEIADVLFGPFDFDPNK